MRSPDEECTFETFGFGGEANFTRFSGGGAARATQGMHSAVRLMPWIAEVPAAGRSSLATTVPTTIFRFP